MRLNIILGLSIFFFTSIAMAQEAQLPFEQWLAELKKEATDKGYRPETINLAFSEITPPVQKIIKKDRNQPETVQTYDSYLEARINAWKTTHGKRLLKEHSELLKAISAEFGVQPEFIVSIWGMETNFGTYPIKQPIFNALATLAYDKRRGALYRAQFLDALAILDSGFPSYEAMTSSWAGAMGQTQFMPEIYRKYAVDFDNDGKRDIWNSTPDVLASIANRFKTLDWDADQTWGRKVLLPANGETSLPALQASGVTPDRFCKRYKTLGEWRNLQAWAELGVTRIDGTALPTRDIPAALIIADQGDNKGYLVYRNFCSIMGYNPAFKYALSIGLLADAISADE
jgi:membrane-bound lytic murein transglycosylase B